MRIIEKGLQCWNPKQPLTFRCSRCGCVFEMDNTEYKVDQCIGGKIIYASCPNCGVVSFPNKESNIGW